MKLGRRQSIPGWWRANQWLIEGAFTLIVGAIVLVGSYLVGQSQPERRTLDSLGFALLSAGVAALSFRRQYPVVVLIFVNSTILVYLLLGYPKGPNFLITTIVFFTAVMQGRRFIAWAVLAAEFGLFPWLPYFFGNESAPTASGLFSVAGWLIVLATISELTYLRQQRMLRSREEEARRRAGEERLRIARELHDVLGHNISLISVQAGVALHLMDKQPEQARIALSVIKNTSKDTLRELRSVLEILRQVNEEPPRTPSPGLSSLGELVSRAEEVGLEVQTEVSGELRGLPASVDLAAFRIVQEALTNVLRHSGQTTSRIQVIRNEQELTLRINNEVAGEPVRSSNELGQGILGMHERAAALGGVVEAGLRADGGFQVFARLPLDGNSLLTPSGARK